MWATGWVGCRMGMVQPSTTMATSTEVVQIHRLEVHRWDRYSNYKYRYIIYRYRCVTDPSIKIKVQM